MHLRAPFPAASCGHAAAIAEGHELPVGKLPRRRTHIHLARVSVSCDADARTRAAEIGVIDDRCFENMDGQARVAGWQPVCLRRASERRKKGGGWEGGNKE